MKTKMKGKEKRGKAIIGIAMAAVIVVALMAMAPTVSAQRVYYDGDVIIIGETNVSFNVGVTTPITDGVIKGPTDDIGTTGKNSTIITFGTYLDTTEYEDELVQAGYHLLSAAGSYIVYFNTPSLTVKTLKTGETDEVTSCTKGSTIDIELKTNLEHINGTQIPDKNVDFKITDPKGVKRDVKNETLDGSGNKIITFDGTDEVGEYTVYVKTKDTYCNGLDMSGSSITFTVSEAGVTLTSDVDTQAKGGEIVFSGTTNPKKQVNLTVSAGTDANVCFIGGKGDMVADHWGTDALITVTASKTGAFSFVCNFTDTGSYTIKAEIDDGDYTAKVSVDITSEFATVTTDKASYSVGEDVKIAGTSNIGDTVAIAIDDVFKKEATIKDDNTFEYKWDSAGQATGSYKIEVWIIPTTLAAYPGNDVAVTDATTTGPTGDVEIADATTSILLTSAELTAKLDKTAVALGDEVVISGTAPGSTEVEILSIAPKGHGGHRLDGNSGGDGYYRETATVSSEDYTFSKKISISKDADTGTHYIAVFVLGGDGYYGSLSPVATGTADGITTLAAPAGAIQTAGYSFTGKTLDQCIEMLKDATIGAVGNDDIMWESTLGVESAFVVLDPLADVKVGDTLNITGTCNREKYPILITAKGPGAATTVVYTASVTPSDGKFSASADTEGWSVGTYTIEADDGDGHTDTVTVEILTEVPVVEPTVEPTAEPTAAPTAAPTEVPTKVPTEAPEPTATPEPPGFEAVFAIAGLLSIAYLVLRKRRE